MKICKVCGKPIPPESRRRSFCSDECYRENERKRINGLNKKRQVKATIERRKREQCEHYPNCDSCPHSSCIVDLEHDHGVCPHCGREFVKSTPQQKFCSRTCYSRANSKKFRERHYGKA